MALTEDDIQRLLDEQREREQAEFKRLNPHIADHSSPAIIEHTDLDQQQITSGRLQDGFTAQQNADLIYSSLTVEGFDKDDKTHIRKSLEEAAKNEKVENFNELLKFEETLIKHPKAFARMLCEFDKKSTNIDSSNEINTRTLFSSLKTYQGQLGLIECCEALNARENENKLVQGVKDFFNKLSVVIANVMEAPFKGALKSARDSSEGVDGKSHVKELATKITGTTLSK